MTGVLQKVEDIDGLWVARRGSLSCFALELREGGLCLYSPVEKLSGVFSDLEPVRFLFAPNHYHNKAVQEFSRAFCQARRVCSEAARPRLEKVTSQDFENLQALNDQLPRNVTLVEPEGLKTGEVWLRVECGDNLAWIVTDAFCGEGASNTKAASLGFLKTFPRYGVQDADRFAFWVQERLRQEVPTHVLPCHGPAVSGPDLGADILRLLERL